MDRQVTVGRAFYPVGAAGWAWTRYVAKEASDITLVTGDPRGVVQLGHGGHQLAAPQALSPGPRFGAGEEYVKSATREEAKRMVETTLKVGGMSCGHCKRSVETALSKLPGVKKVEVSLEKGQARVEHEEGRPTVEAMKLAVREAGYEA